MNDSRDLVLLVGTEQSCRDYEREHPAKTVQYRHIHTTREAYGLRPPYRIVACHITCDDHLEALRYLDRWGTTDQVALSGEEGP